MIGWACARNGLLSGFFAATGHASSGCGCGMSGADVICRRGCDLSGCGCDLSARMWAIPAAVGCTAVRKGHSGGCRQCDCTQGPFRRPSAVRLYARVSPPELQYSCHLGGPHSTQMAKYKQGSNSRHIESLNLK